MTWWMWVGVAWLVVGIVLAVVVGTAIDMADREQAAARQEKKNEARARQLLR